MRRRAKRGVSRPVGLDSRGSWRQGVMAKGQVVHSTALPPPQRLEYRANLRHFGHRSGCVFRSTATYTRKDWAVRCLKLLGTIVVV